MKSIDSIPTSKIRRATKLVKTGMKLGGNYIKYYGEKVVNPENAKANFDKSNADDIYDSLKTLKGSALKVAQMLSMEKNLLPQAYVEKFSLAQFSVPPLSPPLVIKTFKKYFNQSPYDLFDEFDSTSVNAASIGQVHKATKDGKKLAVKIQYPGVADSISSDLALVKPIAMSMFKIPKKDSDKYFREVETKLMEETDYVLELKQSKEVARKCKHIYNLKFPQYYEEYSCKRIITMDWMDGVHLSEFCEQIQDQNLRNKVGQALWQFYMYQLYELKKVHADPHPGNFLVDKEGNLIVIDFGCMKHIPDEFHTPYFKLMCPDTLNNKKLFNEILYELEILKPNDTEAEIQFFTNMFYEMLSLFTQPFHHDEFDFSDEEFFGSITKLAEKYAKDTELRKMSRRNGNRGSKHFIYMNRTFLGLYNLMHALGSTVQIN